jgi:large subunit ribosomal protein L13
MKTYSPKPEHIERRWYVVDASGQVLGRLASEVAALLRGKHKPIFAPHMDTGDHVIVINADKVAVTGGKELKKVAYRHSGYPGGIRGVRYDELLSTRPVFAVEKAVRGMLPKNRLGRSMIRKLHVIAGAEHPHGPQQPVPYAFGQPPMWEGLPQAKPVSTKSDRRAPDEPADGSTVASEPTAKSAVKKPAAKKPAAKKSAAKKSAAKKSAAKKSAAEKPAAEKPAAEKPAAEKPAAEKPAAEKPAAEKSAETTIAEPEE